MARCHEWWRTFAAIVAMALVLAVVPSCSSEPGPRPQLVVVIDTDAPVVGQIVEGSGLSPAVAIDTVRVDVVSSNREVFDHRDVTVPDPRDWPISFGIASQPGTPRALRLRIRAFRASLATRGVLNDVTTIEPPENALIDRIVDLEQADRGVRTVRVVLATACFGAPASFESPARTCIDAERREGSPSEGLLEGEAPSLVGTAPEAREMECPSPVREGARCVPGGATILGDPLFENVVGDVSTVPRRPVLLSPFQMDTTEFTVGRYRRLLARGAVTEVPGARGASGVGSEYCTWLGPNDARNDDLPLNCISYAAAQRACEAEGGQLPSEAQWEHAARGRGRGYPYPWGHDRPQCCTASASRASFPGAQVECGPASGIEPVGSHVEKCPTVDVSVDGILDLGGSLREATRDGGVSYADPCWAGPGLRLDPTCRAPDLRLGGARGGDWSAGTLIMASPIRSLAAMPSPNTGFRCVYAG